MAYCMVKIYESEEPPIEHARLGKMWEKRYGSLLEDSPENKKRFLFFRNFLTKYDWFNTAEPFTSETIEVPFSNLLFIFLLPISILSISHKNIRCCRSNILRCNLFLKNLNLGKNEARDVVF